ncbi:MAG: hypothetical protein ACI9M3_001242, partial [Bacteroidia bacterium]
LKDFSPLQTFDKLNLFIRHLKTKLILKVHRKLENRDGCMDSFALLLSPCLLRRRLMLLVLISTSLSGEVDGDK